MKCHCSTFPPLHVFSSRQLKALSASLTPERSAGIEAVRRVVGAGRFTARNPGSLLEYDPEAPGPCYSATHVVRHLALGYPEPRIL